jgi:hypothetical protein
MFYFGSLTLSMILSAIHFSPWRLWMTFGLLTSDQSINWLVHEFQPTNLSLERLWLGISTKLGPTRISAEPHRASGLFGRFGTTKRVISACPISDKIWNAFYYTIFLTMDVRISLLFLATICRPETTHLHSHISLVDHNYLLGA